MLDVSEKWFLPDLMQIFLFDLATPLEKEERKKNHKEKDEP